MRKNLRKPRLLEERNKLIRIAYRDDGFFIEEIAQMFNLGKSAIGRIVFESKVAKK